MMKSHHVVAQFAALGLVIVIGSSGALMPALGTQTADEPEKIALPSVSQDQVDAWTAFLNANHRTPEAFVAQQFEDHDIVFLGEFHRIRENLLLVHRLVPILQRQGIHNLGIEFARAEDQPLIDTLISSPVYDEAMARQLVLNLDPFWGFQEYADLYLAAWRVNRSLPEGEKPFRVIGLNASPDWNFVKTDEDRRNREVMSKVFAAGGDDERMAQTVMEQVVEKGEKALVYCGFNHAITRYRQPIVDNETGEFIRFVPGRFGNRIKDEIGRRTCTIILHTPWRGAGSSRYDVYPADGMIDALMQRVSPRYGAVGFDPAACALGKMPIETTYLKYGYENFSLSDYCDGYIYQCPLSQYTGVTPIPHFINARNLAQAKAQATNPWFKQDEAKAEHFLDAMRRSGDIAKRFNRFQ